jgi:PAS domain S-box-containing protein
MTGGPVIVKDLSTELRFPGPSILHDHGVTSGVSLVIPGAEPFGVLAAHTSERRSFSAQEVAFLQAAVEILGQAIHCHHAHEAIRQSEEQFRCLFDGSPIGIAIVGPDQRFLRANRAACRVIGYSEEELRQLTIYQITPSDDHTNLRELAGKLARGEISTLQVEQRALSKSGKPVLVKLTVAVDRDNRGNPLHTVLMIEDLTEHRQREQELRLARFTLDHAQEVIGWIGPDGRIRDDNESMCRFFGYSRQELLSMRAPDVDPTISTETWPEEWQKLVRQGALSLESRFRRKDGVEVPVEVNVNYLEYNGAHYACTIARDITERKRAAAELGASEARYRALFENAATMILAVDLKENITAVNRTGERLLGYPREELVGRNLCELLPPGQCDIARGMTAQKLREGGTTTYELDMPAKDGGRLPMQITSTLVHENGKPVGVQGIAIDISEQRRAKEALQRSEEHFRALVEDSMDLTSVISTNGKVLYVSPSIERMLGHKPEDRVGRSSFEIIHPDDAAAVREAIARVIETPGASATLEFRVRHRDGSWRHFEAVVRSLLDNPVVSGIVVNSRDISDRKAAELELQRMRGLLSEGERIAHLGSWEYLAETQETVWSEEEFNIYGLDPAAPSPVYQDLLRNHIHPDDAAALDKAFGEALRTGSIFDREHRIVRPDGSTRFLHNRAHPYFEDGGKLLRYVGATLDITERKRAEDALHESEERFRTLFENATVGIYRTTPDGRILMANPMLIRMLGFETFEELAKRNLEEEGFEPQYSRAMFRKQIEQQGVIEGLEAAWRKHDGSLAFIRESARAIRDHDGCVMYYDGIVEDISDRKRAEEELHRTQRELRALTARLLSNEDEEHRSLASDLHDDFVQRLTALGFDLAAVEGACPAKVSTKFKKKLHTAQANLADLSADLRRVAHRLHPSVIELLGLPVAVRELCQHVSVQGRFAVRFCAGQFPEPVPPNGGLCLYRVAQECLRNIVKHAKAEKVSVTLAVGEQGLRLSVKDNGIGFDTAAAPSNGGLGLISIRERVRLAGGTLTIKSRPGLGTQVTADVPVSGLPSPISVRFGAGPSS